MKSRSRSRKRRGAHRPSITNCSSGMCAPPARRPRRCAKGLNHSRPAPSVPTARLHAVGYSEQRVRRKQRRTRPGRSANCWNALQIVAFLGGSVLQFQHRQRQAIDEQHHIRPARVFVLDDAELVYHQPVVVVDLVEVDDLRLPASDVALAIAILDGHAVHQQAVQRAVAHDDVPRPHCPNPAVSACGRHPPVASAGSSG